MDRAAGWARSPERRQCHGAPRESTRPRYPSTADARSNPSSCRRRRVFPRGWRTVGRHKGDRRVEFPIRSAVGLEGPPSRLCSFTDQGMAVSSYAIEDRGWRPRPPTGDRQNRRAAPSLGGQGRKRRDLQFRGDVEQAGGARALPAAQSAQQACRRVRDRPVGRDRAAAPSPSPPQGDCIALDQLQYGPRSCLIRRGARRATDTERPKKRQPSAALASPETEIGRHYARAAGRRRDDSAPVERPAIGGRTVAEAAVQPVRDRSVDATRILGPILGGRAIRSGVAPTFYLGQSLQSLTDTRHERRRHRRGVPPALRRTEDGLAGSNGVADSCPPTKASPGAKGEPRRNRRSNRGTARTTQSPAIRRARSSSDFPVRDEKSSGSRRNWREREDRTMRCAAARLCRCPSAELPGGAAKAMDPTRAAVQPGLRFPRGSVRRPADTGIAIRHGPPRTARTEGQPYNTIHPP